MKDWLLPIFATKQARSGGIVRRKINDVLKYGSVLELKDEVRERGWHLIQVADQFVVICHTGPVKLLVHH